MMRKNTPKFTFSVNFQDCDQTSSKIILNKAQKNNTYAEKLFILAINTTTYLVI